MPERVDQPTSPIYDSRPNRVSAVAALAIDVFDQLKIGGGVNLTPSLSTPTTVTFVPGRSTSIQNDVEVSLDRNMPLAASPFLGARVQPLSWLGLVARLQGLGRVARERSADDDRGPDRGGLARRLPHLLGPRADRGGSGARTLQGRSLSVDATYSVWSSFQTGFDQPVCVAGVAPPEQGCFTPGFNDTMSVAGGVEWTSTPWLTLRAGGGYEPTPIPPQTGNTNYLGADTTVVALGAGLDLRKLVHAPMLIDFHVRGRIGDRADRARRTRRRCPTRTR